MKHNLFNNNSQNNSELIGQTFENYCYRHAVTERINIDSKETKIEKNIREIFNQHTSNLTIFDDIFKIEDNLKDMVLELREIIPYFTDSLSKTNFYSPETKKEIIKYYNLMQYSSPKLSELVENKMLLCSGENLLFLKSIPKNGFKIYHELTEKKHRRTHSLIGADMGSFSLIIDLSENIVSIREKEKFKKDFLEAIILEENQRDSF